VKKMTVRLDFRDNMRIVKPGFIIIDIDTMTQKVVSMQVRTF